MEKKTFIIATVVTAVVVAGGLFWLRSSLLSANDDNNWQLVNGLLVEQTVVGGVSYQVPPDQIYDVGVGSGEVPALINPEFSTVAAMDRIIGDDLSGIDVTVNGKHRFYPDQVMNWHQVVNDTFEERSLLVVHDPLSGTSVAYENIASFSASGKVYNSTLLMTEGSGSLWLASRGIAVAGPMIGQELKQYPSRTMSWGTWKERYPDGEVLSSSTGYVRDYTRHPYGEYDQTPMVYFPLNSTDARLAPKSPVSGLDINGEQLAIPRDVMAKVNVANDTVGGVALTVFYDWEAKRTNIFSATVSTPAEEGPIDQVLSFTYDIGHDIYIDNETGSEWTSSGVCTKGTLLGEALTPINAPDYYWFAWAAVFPDTRINPEPSAIVTTPNE